MTISDNDSYEEKKAEYRAARDRLYAAIEDVDAAFQRINQTIIVALQRVIEWRDSLPEDMRIQIQAEDEEEGGESET